MGPRILIIVFSLTYIIFMVILIFVLLKKKKLKQNNALGNLKASGLMKSANSGTGTLNGISYKFEYFSGGRNAPSYFRILLDNTDYRRKGSFTIKKESSFDRFFKRLGIISEVQTSDKFFDDRFYISSDTPNFTQTYFSNDNKRKAVQEIYAGGYNEIHFSPLRIEAKCTPVKKDFKSNKEQVENIVSHLTTLSKDIPDVMEIIPPHLINWQLKRLLVFIFAALFILSGIAFLIIGFSQYKPLDGSKIFFYSLPLFLILYLLFGWLSIKLLRGRSTSHHEIVIALAIGIIGFMLFSFGGIILFNGALDNSSENTIETIVIHKYYTKNKNSYSYFAIVESWRPEHTKEKLKVSKRLYNNIHIDKSCMLVTTKSGKFGYEWLVNYELISK